MTPTPVGLTEARRQAAAGYRRNGRPDPTAVARLVEAERAHTASFAPRPAEDA